MKINLERNKEYYEEINYVGCNCDYCMNYYKYIKGMYPKIEAYLSSLNVDILKPLELMWFDADKNNIAEYRCQFVVFGTCEDDYEKEIDGVEFYKTSIHPGTGIKDEEHFVLEFGPIKMKMK
ncbi:MAG: hypothetical protein IJ220_08910 [Clostridia bacterium]|nr:hypothetical protein [Clostridia bacterium]